MTRAAAQRTVCQQTSYGLEVWDCPICLSLLVIACLGFLQGELELWHKLLSDGTVRTWVLLLTHSRSACHFLPVFHSLPHSWPGAHLCKQAVFRCCSNLLSCAPTHLVVKPFPPFSNNSTSWNASHVFRSTCHNCSRRALLASFNTGYLILIINYIYIYTYICIKIW